MEGDLHEKADGRAAKGRRKARGREGVGGTRLLLHLVAVARKHELRLVQLLADLRRRRGEALVRLRVVRLAAGPQCDRRFQSESTAGWVTWLERPWVALQRSEAP